MEKTNYNKLNKDKLVKTNLLPRKQMAFSKQNIIDSQRTIIKILFLKNLYMKLLIKKFSLINKLYKIRVLSSLKIIVFGFLTNFHWKK